MKQWCRDHSLSLALFSIGLVFIVASRIVPQGGWWYDFTMGFGQGSWTTAAVLRLSAWLVERGADHLKTREELQEESL